MMCRLQVLVTGTVVQEMTHAFYMMLFFVTMYAFYLYIFYSLCNTELSSNKKNKKLFDVYF